MEKEILNLIISMGESLDKYNPDLELRKEVFEWMTTLEEIANRLNEDWL